MLPFKSQVPRYVIFMSTESNNVKDTAQLLLFIWGINDTFEITEKFLTMEMTIDNDRKNWERTCTTGCPLSLKIWSFPGVNL